MIRVVVFDFDGTLVVSNGAKQECLTKAVAPFANGAAALSEALGIGGNRYKVFGELARRLDTKGDSTELARRLVRTYSQCCARAIYDAPERQGARSALTSLRRRGLRLWINSGTPQSELRELVTRRGLRPHLRGMLGSPTSKAENLQKIMRIERVAPGQVMHVGDSVDDLTAAREVGTWFVAINAEDRIDEPVRYAIRNLTPLLGILRKIHPLARPFAATVARNSP